MSLASPATAAALFSVCLAGCSADISRFDLGSSPIQTNSTPTRDANFGSARTAEQNRVAYDYGRQNYQPPPAYGSGNQYNGPTRTALAPPPQAQPTYGQQQMRTAALPPSEPMPSRQPVYQTAAAEVPPASIEPGEAIVVRSGDTLYRLSRKHGVSVGELKSVNGLTGNNIRVGQRLRLPAGVAAHPAAAPTKTDYTRTVSPPSNWTSTYEVRSGDSLYSIARSNNVSISELQRYNRIADPRTLRPGTMLRVPATESASSDRVAPIEAPAAEPVTTASTTVRPSGAPNQPKILNSGRTQVARNTTSSVSSDANTNERSRSVASGGSKLRWPLTGKIVSAFGPRSDGTHNDGINIAAPVGADVHAAEAGVVAYAGDELKGYGNLILLRHDNGWVTAYAHADEILVKRGDRVKRGQVVAKAGRTGQVDQPQLHFELRQGQKPVDPRPFLESR